MTRPLSTEADAKSRAWRTFAQGLFLDVAAVLAVVLATASTNVEWTVEYWYGIGALAAKTIVQTAVAYVARKVLPPSA